MVCPYLKNKGVGSSILPLATNYNKFFIEISKTISKKTIIINIRKVLPNSIENKIPNNRFVYYFAWLLLGFNFFRSLEHIFNEDGGAEIYSWVYRLALIHLKLQTI